jgi:hypothetical protein
MTSESVHDPLQQEIDQNRKKIHTDSYSMSVGELINMYRDRELEIHPAYQRLFRWSDQQKSLLIDSILLGIPIPSIFVSQREDGVWEVVDGLQRLSTLFQLAGVLRGPEGGVVAPLRLCGTKYLAALEGKRWESEDPATALSPTQKLLIKRAKIDVQIVLKESDVSSKYELFQRLNAGGTSLSPMEVRNCLLIMVNPRFAQWIGELASNEDFKAIISQTDNALEQMGDRELVCRFVAFRRLTLEDIRAVGDVSQFLDDRLTTLATNPHFDYDREQGAFEATFRMLREALGVEAFRRFNATKELFEGKFLISVFEVLALGLGYYQPDAKVSAKFVKQVATRIWENPEFTANIGAGVRANSRVQKTIPLGRREFRTRA